LHHEVLPLPKQGLWRQSHTDWHRDFLDITNKLKFAKSLKRCKGVMTFMEFSRLLQHLVACLKKWKYV